MYSQEIQWSHCHGNDSLFNFVNWPATSRIKGASHSKCNLDYRIKRFTLIISIVFGNINVFTKHTQMKLLFVCLSEKNYYCHLNV